jgi:hypothetical protein
MKRNLPDYTVDQIKEQVALRKKQINQTRVENKIRYKRWLEMIRPLTKEINVVRANIVYHAKANPQTADFYRQYLDALLDTRITLTKHKLERKATPINTDREKRTWVDWVNPKEKEELIKLYDSIPYCYKAKRKAIFPRPKLKENQDD